MYPDFRGCAEHKQVVDNVVSSFQDVLIKGFLYTGIIVCVDYLCSGCLSEGTAVCL